MCSSDLFESRYNQQVTMAEIILHYARATAFNIGESVRYWVEYFLSFNELNHIIDGFEMGDTILELNKHAYFNSMRNTYGMFGLTAEQFEAAARVASFNVHDEITYEMEFNEFLKSCL